MLHQLVSLELTESVDKLVAKSLAETAELLEESIEELLAEPLAGTVDKSFDESVMF